MNSGQEILVRIAKLIPPYCQLDGKLLARISSFKGTFSSKPVMLLWGLSHPNGELVPQPWGPHYMPWLIKVLLPLFGEFNSSCFLIWEKSIKGGRLRGFMYCLLRLSPYSNNSPREGFAVWVKGQRPSLDPLGVRSFRLLTTHYTRIHCLPNTEGFRN